MNDINAIHIDTQRLMDLEAELVHLGFPNVQPFPADILDTFHNRQELTLRAAVLWTVHLKDSGISIEEFCDYKLCLSNEARSNVGLLFSARLPGNPGANRWRAFANKLNNTLIRQQKTADDKGISLQDLITL
ncbi:hypothetical protein [Aeromonas salmonicida]|uniref:hypothetical protein n=1 Tax=Aeromonas salmonicida TaxID=645 RepID=UPI0038BD31B4